MGNLLSFGCDVEVLELERIQQIISERMREASKLAAGEEVGETERISHKLVVRRR